MWLSCDILACTENKDGKTPIDLAEETSYDECIELVSLSLFVLTLKYPFKHYIVDNNKTITCQGTYT